MLPLKLLSNANSKKDGGEKKTWICLEFSSLPVFSAVSKVASGLPRLAQLSLDSIFGRSCSRLIFNVSRGSVRGSAK